MPEPKGKLVTPVGFDAAGNLVALLIDADGHVQVDQLSFPRAGTGSYNQIAVDTTAVLVIAANTSRLEAIVQSAGSGTIYIGFDAGVTTSNGLPIASGYAITFQRYTGPIYAIAAAAGEKAAFMEVA